MAATWGRLRRSVAGYAELVRLPNLFTAPPDVFLGAALAAGGIQTLPPATVFGLSLASVSMYAAGTALNDYFDADVDAAERPGRPIPSGRVPRLTALKLGFTLLAAGVLVAFLAGGTATAAVAAALAGTILAYDGVLKGGPAGFVAMGLTRGLNVTLGLVGAVDSAAPVRALGELPSWVFVVPAVIAAYIATVTYMAADEATGVDRTRVLVAAAGTVSAALSVSAVWLLTERGSVRASEVDPGLLFGGALVLAFVAWVGRALVRAFRDPRPAVVGPAVGTCVLGLVVLDAAFAAVTAPWTAVAALTFLGPAVGLSRAFAIS